MLVTGTEFATHDFHWIRVFDPARRASSDSSDITSQTAGARDDEPEVARHPAGAGAGPPFQRRVLPSRRRASFSSEARRRSRCASPMSASSATNPDTSRSSPPRPSTRRSWPPARLAGCGWPGDNSGDRDPSPRKGLSRMGLQNRPRSLPAHGGARPLREAQDGSAVSRPRGARGSARRALASLARGIYGGKRRHPARARDDLPERRVCRLAGSQRLRPQIGKAIGYGWHVRRAAGVDADFVMSGDYALEVAGERVAAAPS